MSIPSWILEVEDEGLRTTALKALAEYEQIKKAADATYDAVLREANADRERKILKAKADYDAARQAAREFYAGIKLGTKRASESR